VADAIAAAKPDVLFVAMTSPMKERFMARWSARMNVPVCHGVGGSFDVMAGKVERAPALWQRLGLEWLYRVKQEPGRLWKRYLFTNVAFVKLVAREWVRRLTARPRRQAA
jgi:N-acetylglucosaminyldiphosphoundecaprenol N-acetyl-beta-D-mannosaminyltransferase